MATDVERLVVQLSADIKRFENAMNKANGVANKSARSIERRFATMNKKLSSQFAALGGVFSKGLAIAGVAGGVRGAQDLIDSAVRINNALKVVGLSGDNLTKVYDRLYDSAQKNAAPFESLVSLFSRASLVQKELGVSTDELLGFTDKIAVALRVSGQSAEQAQGALLQLGQALSTGVVRAEEYNSLQEGLVPVLRAVAVGLKEAGGSVGTLTNLVKTGQVSSEAFFRAFEAGSVILDEQVKNATYTTSQGFEILHNSLVKAASKFNESTETSERLGGALQAMAAYIDAIDFDNILHGLDAVADKMNYVNGVVQNFGAALGAALGTENLGKWLAGTSFGSAIGMTSPAGIRDRMSGDVPQADKTIQEWAERNYGPAHATPTTGRLPAAPKVNPVSLADYAVPAKAKKTGRTHAVKKTEADAFNEDIDDIKKRTAALAEEQASLRLSYYEQQKRKVSLELEQKALESVREAARKKGDQDWQNKTLSEEQKKTIDDVSAAYAAQADSLRKASEAYDLQKDILKGAFSDIRSALEDGKITAQEWGDIFLNILDKIVDKIENDLVDSILEATNAGKSGGGFFSSLLGLFGGGGSSFGTTSGFADMLGLATGGRVAGAGSGTSDSIPAMLSNGEYVINAAATKKYGPLLDAINSGKALKLASGGPVSAPTMPRLATPYAAGGQPITYAPVYNVAQGADPKAIAELREAQARDRAEFSGRVVQTIRGAKKRNMKGL